MVKDLTYAHVTMNKQSILQAHLSKTVYESLVLLPMCPGFDSQTWGHMWVEFVAFLLCTERFFPGYSGPFTVSPIFAPAPEDLDT